MFQLEQVASLNVALLNSMAIYLTYSNVCTDNDLDLPGHNLT